MGPSWLSDTEPAARVRTRGLSERSRAAPGRSSSAQLFLIVYAGTADRLYPAGLLAARALERGESVDVLLTFWALMAALKTPAAFANRVSRDYGAQGEAFLELLHERVGASWMDVMRQAQGGSLRVRACAFTLDLFDLTLDDLDPLVEDVVGIGSFIDEAEQGRLLVF